MEVTITVDDRQVRALLDQTPARIDRALRAGMTDATVHLLRQLRTYPPQRAGSAYKRTNTLKGSWSRRIEGRGLEMVGHVESNGNVAPYNRLVQDRTRQAQIHRTLWTNTAQGVSERSERAINDMFTARIQAALR
jgi:hypothetical protein